MNQEISKLYPVKLWENFCKICSIPHPSKKEAKITAFIKEEGARLGLETIADLAGNVLIKALVFC